jgi:hypothetical protein
VRAQARLVPARRLAGHRTKGLFSPPGQTDTVALSDEPPVFRSPLTSRFSARGRRQFYLSAPGVRYRTQRPLTRGGKMALSRLGSTRLVLAIVAGLAATAACKKTEAPPPPPPAVEVAPVVQKDVPIFQEWIGSLDGFVNAEIRPQIEGCAPAGIPGRLPGSRGRDALRDRPASVPGDVRPGQGHPGPVRGHLANATTTAARYRPGGAEGDQPAGARRRRDEGAHREANVESAGQSSRRRSSISGGRRSSPPSTASRGSRSPRSAISSTAWPS